MDSKSGTKKTIFEGRRALVVGGTGGIGRAVALGLAERGALVGVHGGFSRKRLAGTLEAIAKAGGKGVGFLCPAEETGAAERILAHFPEPDILVCSWGPFKQGALEDLDGEFWQKITWGNLIFPGTIVSLAIRGMVKNNYGRILLFGGTNTDTIRGFTTTAVYSAAKTALGVVAKSAARTGAKQGVTCNVICPGLTDTEYLDETARSYNRERSPCGRALETADIACTALGILENPGINGAVVSVDQGVVL